MAKRRKSEGQSGGVQISGGKVRVGGDIVGHDKITTTRAGVGGEDLDALVHEGRGELDMRVPDEPYRLSGDGPRDDEPEDERPDERERKQ